MNFHWKCGRRPDPKFPETPSLIFTCSVNRICLNQKKSVWQTHAGIGTLWFAIHCFTCKQVWTSALRGHWCPNIPKPQITKFCKELRGVRKVMETCVTLKTLDVWAAMMPTGPTAIWTSSPTSTRRFRPFNTSASTQHLHKTECDRIVTLPWKQIAYFSLWHPWSANSGCGTRERPNPHLKHH